MKWMNITLVSFVRCWLTGGGINYYGDGCDDEDGHDDDDGHKREDEMIQMFDEIIFKEHGKRT